MKKCPRCGETKLLDAFGLRMEKGRSGPNGYCKKCMYRRYTLAVDPVSARAKNQHRAELRRADREVGRSAAGQAILDSNTRWANRNADRVKLSVRAVGIVRRALRAGTLVKAAACEQCGATEVAIEGAHADYDQPLLVRWLCRSCHRRWDRSAPKTLEGVTS